MTTKDKVAKMTREELAEELAAAGKPTEDWKTADIDAMRVEVAEQMEWLHGE